MTKRAKLSFTTPPGRMVSGSPYRKRPKTDQFGKPKLIAKGDKAGQVLEMCSLGQAIPKTKDHWKDEEFQLPTGEMMRWGAIIYGEGVAAFPNGQTERPDFAWKIEDGDSMIPNKKGKRNAEREGWKGCWVLFFEGFDLPTVYSSARGAPVLDATVDLIQPGDHIQVNGTVVSNESTQTSGVYLDALVVCYRGVGPRIVAKQQGDTSGFGGGMAPGASAAPAPAPMPAPSTPPVPAPAAPPVPTPVTPDPAYSSATPAPKPQTASKGGDTWPLADLEKLGWTREKLLADGYTIA